MAFLWSWWNHRGLRITALFLHSEKWMKQIIFEISHIFNHNSQLPGFKSYFWITEPIWTRLSAIMLLICANALQLNKICYLQYSNHCRKYKIMTFFKMSFLNVLCLPLSIISLTDILIFTLQKIKSTFSSCKERLFLTYTSGSLNCFSVRQTGNYISHLMMASTNHGGVLSFLKCIHFDQRSWLNQAQIYQRWGHILIGGGEVVHGGFMQQHFAASTSTLLWCEGAIAEPLCCPGSHLPSLFLCHFPGSKRSVGCTG